MEALSTDSLVGNVLHNLNQELATKMKGDCVLITSNMASPLDGVLRVELEKIKAQPIIPNQEQPDAAQPDHLAVVLQTVGGYMETVERLVAVMRTHYERVSFVIPNYAFSAGTVLALSGDDIYMDYYSVLGPIDPQYPGQDGTYRSGYGVLAKFDEICETINTSRDSRDCRAELAYLVKNFDPGQLFQLEQAIQHGKSLITAWLPKYKFKNWTVSERTGKEVTDDKRKLRASEIAEILGDASRWHSHGRGISMQQLSGSDLRLKIEDFGADPELSTRIRNYHGLATDYFSKLGQQAYIHSRIGSRRIA